jgi:(p)ppGpp synthase/HD superfamily hydrolase
MNFRDLRRLVDVAHGAQKYGDFHYLLHLEEVRDVLLRYGFTTEMFPILHQAAYLHDVFEDTNVPPDTMLQLGVDPEAVKLALAVTDEPGPNRKERKIATYGKISKMPAAIILKLADRIANVESGGKIDMYKEEYPTFKATLQVNDYAARSMWEHLDKLLA